MSKPMALSYPLKTSLEKGQLFGGFPCTVSVTAVNYSRVQETHGAGS